MHIPSMTSGSCRAPRARRAFTLLEAVVAAGAIAVVIVGLTAVFRSFGEGLATGRRVSRLNQTIRLIEQSLREDIGRMTRDGFLVIRHQMADADGDGVYDLPNIPAGAPGDDAVPIGPEDSVGRVRRIDEILFFAFGDFRSVRPPFPQDPNWRPESREAMIYYGHGQRGRETLTSADAYVNPQYNDVRGTLTNPAPATDPELDRLGLNNPGNPNRFASSWTLLRHRTLLAPPAVSQSYPSATLFTPAFNPGSVAGQRNLRDGECQIFGQPAAASVFRSVNRALGPGVLAEPPATDTTWYASWTTPAPTSRLLTNYLTSVQAVRSPTLASGLVDVATTNLAEIRRFVSSDNYLEPNGTAGYEPHLYGVVLGTPDGQFDPTGLPGSFTNPRDPNFQSLDFMHLWMNDAFPTDARNQGDLGGGLTDIRAGDNLDPRGVRMHVEPDAMNLLEVIGSAAGSEQLRRSKFLLRADRVALQASALAVAVTEFQVEWSFGQIDPQGQMIWYGRPDLKPRVPPPGSPAGVVIPAASLPLPVRAQGEKYPVGNPYRVESTGDGRITAADHQVTARLIYGADPQPEDLCWTSYFGYTDPTAANSGTPVVLPWAWPKLLRVRVTLADPAAPSPATEQTFEMIFALPERG